MRDRAALAVQHYAAAVKTHSWIDLYTPPGEERMAVLIQEELARREKYLAEALAKSGMGVDELEEERWKPITGW